jgi:biofilm protein TabA
MILDSLHNAVMYQALGPRIAGALDYLQGTDFSKTPLGRHELDGDRLVAIVQRYATKPVDEARWEAHRRYLDVQYVVEGAERMGWAALDQRLPVRHAYDAAKDIVFFETRGELFLVRAGQFAIFAPHDIHAPGLAAGSVPSKVLKVVVKCLYPE